MSIAQLQGHVSKVVNDRSLPALARAQIAMPKFCEHGIDLIPVLKQLIEKSDEAEDLRAKLEQQERAPLVPEVFVERKDWGGHTYARVTKGSEDVYLPCVPEQIEGLEPGDWVLVDWKNLRLAGRDGALFRSGELVTLESVPENCPGGLLVKHMEQTMYVTAGAKLRSNGKPLLPGTRLLFDPVRRFAFQEIDSGSDGTELLTPLEMLDQVGRDQLGAAHPVIDEILFLAKRHILHPEWTALMRARIVHSYMFAGPTGTGKSFHLKVLAKEETDYVEQLTGQRLSRLVMVDAASFYSPLFGQTEINIASFFDRLRTLGRSGVKGKNGQIIPVPLIVVLEEAEALLRSRGEIGGSAHLFDRPLALMLQKLSSVAGELNVPVTFITTTNRADLIDPAAQRRLGIRMALFGTLSAGQAASVLDKKIPPGLPLRNGRGSTTDEDSRQAAINQVLTYLYGNEPEQAIAEARMQDGQRRLICRRDLVTGAHLEEAVSRAIDECLRQSSQAGRLLGLDAQGVIRSLDAQYTSLATILRPHNLPEYLPQWFAGEPLRIESVRPLRRLRRPRSTLVC